MAVDATMMFREVDLVAKAGQGAALYRIDCQILADGKWYTPYKLDLWMQERNYQTDWGEGCMVSIMIGLGTYTYQLAKNRDNLIVDLKFVPVMENSGSQRSDLKARIYRYRAIIMNQMDPTLSNKQSQASNEEALNRLPQQVQLQLMSETNYRLSMVSTGRIFRQVAPLDAVYALLTEAMQKVGGNNDEKLKGINVAPGYNTQKRNILTVPQGTLLKRVTHYVHEEEGGLYPTGVNCFIQDQYFWIYPLYNVENTNKQLKTLKVYNVPSNRLDGAERTYRLTDNQVIVLATGDATSLNQSLNDKLNAGNGVRFADARKLLDGFAVTKDNRLLMDRATNMFETVGTKLATAFNNVSWAGAPTGNPYVHYSELASKQGQQVTMTWRYGDSDLLFPGMPVEFSTVIDDKMHTYRGVLHRVNEQRLPAQDGAVADRHPSSINLTLFINTEAELG